MRHDPIVDYNKVVEALERYFKHDIHCQQIQSIEPHYTPCNCGAREGYVVVMEYVRRHKP